MPATKPKEKSFRVGLLIAGSLAVLMIFLFFIGSEQKIFARKNEYEVRFDTVAGLAEGNPVKISGVTVGVIRDITLPRDPKQRDVHIVLMVDRKYQELIRGDSRARLKKLGLLAGDSYIDVTPGDPRFPMLEAGAVIPAQRQTNVDQLISSGEDLVDNFVQISYSLKNILSRVDRGEGLLGELTSSPETKQRITDTFLTTLNKTNAALRHMESGKGLMGKLVYDDAFSAQLSASLTSSAQSLQNITGNIQRGLESNSGIFPALLHDAEGKKKIYDLVENLRTTSTNLAAFSATLQTGQGILPRLMSDKPFADESMAEFTTLVRQLNAAVAKINNGEGTAGKLITDPSVYESINDILIGINESKLLRWLIRNRQQSGIEKRVETERLSGAANAPATAGVPDVPVTVTIAPVLVNPPATSTQPAPTAPEPEKPPVAPDPVKTDTTSTAPPATTSTAPPATSTAPAPPPGS